MRLLSHLNSSRRLLSLRIDGFHRSQIKISTRVESKRWMKNRNCLAASPARSLATGGKRLHKPKSLFASHRHDQLFESGNNDRIIVSCLWKWHAVRCVTLAFSVRAAGGSSLSHRSSETVPTTISVLHSRSSSEMVEDWRVSIFKIKLYSFQNETGNITILQEINPTKMSECGGWFSIYKY